MKNKDFTAIVPEHCTGKEIEACASVTLDTLGDASIAYRHARERLFDINNWHRIAGTISARFQLLDASGKQVDRSPHEADFIRVDIPGPGIKQAMVTTG